MSRTTPPAGPSDQLDLPGERPGFVARTALAVGLVVLTGLLVTHAVIIAWFVAGVVLAIGSVVLVEALVGPRSNEARGLEVPGGFHTST